MFLGLGALSCFWPFLLSPQDTVFERTPLYYAVTDERFTFTSLMAITLAVPFAIDAIIDGYASFCGESACDRKRTLLTVGERMLMVIGFVIPNFVEFVPSSYDNVSLLWICASRFQQVAVFGSTWSSFSRYDPCNFPKVVFWFGMSSLILGAVLSSYRVVFPNDATTIDIVSTIFRYIGFIMYYFGLIKWHLRRLKFLLPFITKSSVSPSESTGANTSSTQEKPLDNNFFPIAYIDIVSIGMVIILIMMSLTVSAEFHTPVSLTVYNSGYLLLQLGILVFYLRKVKYDELFHLRSLVDSKKTYLRFVAHELRTPLNSASLGMNWLIKTLNEIEEKDEFDQELTGRAALRAFLIAPRSIYPTYP